MIVVQDYWGSPIPDFAVFLAAKEVIDQVLANELKEGVDWGSLDQGSNLRLLNFGRRFFTTEPPGKPSVLRFK